MRVTIINDGTVYVDGVAHAVRVDIPAPFHAMQWDGTRGEVEYSVTTCDHCGARSRKPNETISDIAPYQKYVDAWHVAADKAAADAQAAALTAENRHDAGPQS